MTEAYGKVLLDLTEGYLAGLVGQPLPAPTDITKDLLIASNQRIELENAVLPKDERWRKLRNITPAQMAAILMSLHHACRIQCAGQGSDPSTDLLGAYAMSGPNAGTYVTDENAFYRIMLDYDPEYPVKSLQETYFILNTKAQSRTRTVDPDLVPVNNGIFNFRQKVLYPFTPECIFLTKSKVDYVRSPANPVLTAPDGTKWDVESWMAELSDDPEIVNVLWEVCGAVIRPFVPWNKSAWFYSESGNSGKGTLCALMRNLCGPDAWCNIPLTHFSKDFALTPLTHSTAIITDENDVGSYVDKAANLKAVVTGDAILLDRKFKNPISFQFRGFMVQCINEMPRIRDRSDSFYRRQLFIPFDKCFTGAERTYIKSDYLARRDVLEYVLNRVLHMDYYELSEPSSCKDVLDDYKTFNDPVRDFLDDILPQCQWDLLPFSFLYALYKAWFRQNVPSGTPYSRNMFINAVSTLANTGNLPDWETSRNVIWSAGRMDAYEPLITQYGMTDWMDPDYTGTDKRKQANFTRAAGYRGLVKQNHGTAVPPAPGGGDD